MSYPSYDLDDYSTEDLLLEIKTRARTYKKENCPYCQAPLDEHTCKYSPLNKKERSIESIENHFIDKETILMNYRDLPNIMRHTYLLGWNMGWAQGQDQAKVAKPDFDVLMEDMAKDREEIISELIAEHIAHEGTCYNDYPCTCPPESRQDDQT